MRPPFSAPVVPVTAELVDALNSLHARANESRKVENQSISSLRTALKALGEEARSGGAELGKTFRLFRETIYSPAVAALSPDEREVLTKQIQVLEETKRLSSVRALRDQLRELRTLSAQLRLFCEAVCNIRDKVAQSRSDLIAALNAELPGVKLDFRRAANREGRDRFQGAYPSDGASLIEYVDRFDGRDAYEKMRDLFATLETLDIDQDKWTIEKHLFDAKFVDLLDVMEDDDVGIS